jgi:putative tryptophan/tyrosine transport system substrate-binding protein
MLPAFGEAMRRRHFITLLGGAAALWSPAARTQQPTVPVVGFLHPSPQTYNPQLISAFRDGLKDKGYADGKNVVIEYRWGNDDVDRLPAIAAELVYRKVSVLATVGHEPAFAAKRATNSIPVLFIVGADPVRLGLVRSFARPGGNLTGVNIITTELTAKRLELLRALMPKAMRVGLLVDPTNVVNTETAVRDAEDAARSMGLKIQVLNASTPHDIDAAFAAIVSERLDALFVDLIPFFSGRRAQLIDLSARYAVPAFYGWRQFAESGGLMSYGTSLADAYHQEGIYAGRVLKGEKPADLPVVQPTKFELVINLKTAKALGLHVPDGLLSVADAVIE